MYHAIDILVATMHKKEIAIRQPFKERFDANLIITTNLDTDQFGTFTGERKRNSSAYETVLNKAEEGLKLNNYDYAIANEGSFGQHPSIPFIAADTELMCFVDKVNDIVVVESILSTDTNYSHIDITIDNDINNFLSKARFGSHGIIVKESEKNRVIAKGVTAYDHLMKILKTEFRHHRTLRLETDMRAMLNPTRMKIINQLAIKLVNRLSTYCSNCSLPGFGKISYEGNLPCSWCSAMTDLYQYKILSCIKCTFKEIHQREDGLINADPTYCHECNP